jgi:hypothetical protein
MPARHNATFAHEDRLWPASLSRQAAQPPSSPPRPQYKEGAGHGGDVEHQGGWQQSQDHSDMEANKRPGEADERARHVAVSRYEFTIPIASTIRKFATPVVMIAIKSAR